MAASAYFRRVSSRVIEQLLADPSRVKQVLFPSSTETVIDDEVMITIGEGYALLEQALQPRTFITAGGTPIGDIVVGDGPARALRAAEVRKIAGSLAPVSAADVRRALERIPLPSDAPSIAEIVESYESLRELVMTTAQAEAGLIVYIG